MLRKITPVTVVAALCALAPALAGAVPGTDPGDGGGTDESPTIARTSSSVTVAEGSQATNGGTYGDNEPQDVTLAASTGNVTWEVLSPTQGTWQWTHTPDDGPADSGTVTITITDSAEQTASTSFSLNVQNVPPHGVLRAPAAVAAVDEGSGTFAVSYTNATDPSAADRAAGFQYAFKCGSAGYGDWGTANSSACPAPDDGPSTTTVTAKIRDKDGGVREHPPRTVDVLNVAPSGTLIGPSSSVAEGGASFVLEVTDPTDPSSADRAAGFEYAFDCGGGYGAFGVQAGLSCTSREDGPATYTVTAKIRDKDHEDGGVRELGPWEVEVHNVAPVAVLHSRGSAESGQTFQISLEGASDNSGADQAAGFTYRFDCPNTGFGDWGTANSTTCTAGNAGTQTVRGQIRDKDDGVREYTGTVTVSDGGVVAPPVVAPPVVAPPVVAPVVVAPANTSPPKVSGKAKVGKKLKASTGTWSGSEPIAYGYSWLRCNRKGKRCKPIARATAGTYKLKKADAKRKLRVAVTGRNTAGKRKAVSAPSKVVKGR